jgi:hypothetical protein
MSLINVSQYESTKGNKWNIQGTLLRAGIDNLKNKGLYVEEGHEKIIDIFELMLELNKIVKSKDKRCRNKNNPTGKTK